MLHEVVGDAFEVQRVPLYDGIQYGAEFLALNPNHNVPVLELTWDDASVKRLLESVAMVEFLADAFPEKNLAPRAQASPARADYLQMMHMAGTWLDMMLWQIRAHENLLPKDHRDPRTASRYRHKIAAEIELQLECRLEASSYICGESFTAADCVVGHCVFWARGYGLCRGSAFKACISRISKRPAFLAAFSDVAEFSTDIPDGKPMAEYFSG